MQSPFDALRATLRERLQPQSMRLLCGEMSNAEMRTSIALINWVLRMCEKHEPKDMNPLGADEEALKRALQALSRAKRNHPDSLSSAALHKAEEEIRAEFAKT